MVRHRQQFPFSACLDTVGWASGL